jgi:hypothetical protein
MVFIKNRADKVVCRRAIVNLEKSRKSPLFLTRLNLIKNRKTEDTRLTRAARGVPRRSGDYIPAGKFLCPFPSIHG